MTLLMAFIIATSGGTPLLSQKKKSPYYYSRYHRKTYLKMPVFNSPEKFGWSFLLSKPNLTSSYFQRNIIRSFFLQKGNLPNFNSVIKAFKLDPDSGDGRFLVQFYLYLTGKTYKLPPPERDLSSSRTNMLNFFNSLKKGDLLEMENRLYSLGATNHQLLKFILRLAVQLKNHGFLKGSYSLFRKALSILELQNYSLKISFDKKQLWFHTLVIYMAEIAHKRGEYRKAWGILKWYDRNTPGATMEKVKCSYKKIIAGKCETGPQTKKSANLLTDKETAAYHQALIKWRKDWKSGQQFFTDFLKTHPRSSWKKQTKKFIFWLKHNPK